jgi:hypothetical protein
VVAQPRFEAAEIDKVLRWVDRQHGRLPHRRIAVIDWMHIRPSLPAVAAAQHVYAVAAKKIDGRNAYANTFERAEARALARSNPRAG